MPNELLTVLQKKQAIERGLSHYLQGTVLERVLNYWEQEYGDKPSFVLNRFMNDICNTDELRVHRKEMLKQVLCEMSAVEKQVLLDTQPKVQTKALTALPVSADFTNAFFDLINGVLQAVAAADLTDFNTEVKKQVQALGIAMDKSANLNDAAFTECLALTSYAQVITASYACYCEFYGPSKADQVYARVKMDVKSKYPLVDWHHLL